MRGADLSMGLVRACLRPAGFILLVLLAGGLTEGTGDLIAVTSSTGGMAIWTCLTLGDFFMLGMFVLFVDGRDNIGASAAERLALCQRALNGASGQRVGAWTLSCFGNRSGVQPPDMDSGLGGPLVFYGLNEDQRVTNDPTPQNGGLKLVGSLHPFDG